MELATHQHYQVGPPNMVHGPYQLAYQKAFEVGTYGVQEGRQYSGPIQGFQQTSEPSIKEDPQTPSSSLPFFHSILHHEQDPKPNEMHQEMQTNCTSVYEGMHIQNIAELRNGRNHQQRHPQRIHTKGAPGTPGRAQGQTYAAHNSSSYGLFNRNPATETPFPKLEHEIPPSLPPPTLARTYLRVGGSYNGRPRKAQRVDNVSIHNELLIPSPLTYNLLRLALVAAR